MRKLIIIFLYIALLAVPLTAQDSFDLDWADDVRDQAQRSQPRNKKAKEEKSHDDENEPREKKPGFERQVFEVGIDVSAGFDNNLLGAGDILKRNIVIDLSTKHSGIPDKGIDFNLDIDPGFFINIMNIKIAESVWDFGIFTGVEGGVNLNIPKDFLTLLTHGNVINGKNRYSFKGTINASGGVYGVAGLNASGKFGKIKAGIQAAPFFPVIFIPKSGIKYEIDTKDNITIKTGGDIQIYSPFFQEGGFVWDFSEFAGGFDIALEGAYSIFPFLDAGLRLSHIPIVPATMTNRMSMTIEDINMVIDGETILGGDILIPSEIKPSWENDNKKHKVMRPFKLDAYADYKAIQSNMFSLTVIPNIGFTVDINDGDGFFNAGLGVKAGLLKEMFLIKYRFSLDEAVWKNSFGLGFNLRAFELDLQADFRSPSFAGAFKGYGFGLGLGMRFGW